MAFDYLTNLSLEDARDQYLQHLKDLGLAAKTETIPVVSANHRITSRAVYARICAPHYNACAMDGIALKASLTAGANEVSPVSLDETDFVWVNTGDVLPEEADCVVMVEDVIAEGGKINLYAAASPWQHIRQIGEDIAAGDMVVPSYTELNGPIMGSMLAAGVLEAEVFVEPLVGIIPSGNELVSPRENPGKGDIIEFNSTIFSGIFQDWGCRTKVFPIVTDDEQAIVEALESAAEECDVVVLNAGSSAGTKDYSTNAIRKVGDVLCHGISIKPGKPTILGSARRKDKVIPIIGLPGYPVSGILVLEKVFKPVVRLLTGRTLRDEPVVEAISSRRLNSSLKYSEFVRARVGKVYNDLVAVPLSRGAGVVSSFVKADGIIEIPQNVETYKAGEPLSVRLKRPVSDIERTLVITGSHDPLIDEVTDLLRQEDWDTLIASSHVGSMGGIMALSRHEAHMGGVHLLDEESGTYNIPYLRKFFPAGGVRLVHCVQRTQGLMVAKGNLHNIRTLEDIMPLRYVNRQRGSGTRILLDYLGKQAGLDFAQLNGYEREEFTHTSVAASVASDTADAGLGILSAAKIYDLDFIPLCEEQYDIIVDDYSFELPMVQRFIEMLRSKAFKERLEKMGGYTLVNPGEEEKWN